jgi:photosystem II stability/assembly factor-like uncharacterized protein
MSLLARLLLLACSLFVQSSAHANGRLPGANELAIDRARPEHMVARATFGIVESFDRGAHWRWTCEEAIDISGVIADPPLAIVGDGSLVLLPPTGSALVSRDAGCSWETASGPLVGSRGVDLTRDPSDPSRLVVLTSTLTAIDSKGFAIVRNTLVETRDDARTWTLLSTLPSDFEAETVEVAPSDARRIYVSGTASNDPRRGLLLRSEDGGASFQTSSLMLPPGSGSLFVSAIHPRDPDMLWVRVPARGDTIGILPAQLLVSGDKGQTFRQLASTQRAMFGFALSPDGSDLAYGGPSDGLFIGPSDGSAGFRKVAALSVRCLRWTAADALYACGLEPSDPFSVGLSRDRGLTFEPLYRMRDTCPQGCSADTRSGMSCRAAWSRVGPLIGAAGALCDVPWALVSATDAGPASADVDAASSGVQPTDAAIAATLDAQPLGPAEAGPHGGEGCDCHVAARQPARGSLELALAALALLLTRSRWRSLLRRALLSLAALLSLLGCGESSEEASPPRADAATYQGCPSDTPPFALGMEAQGVRGKVRARLRAALPAPPQRYRNDWTLEFVDAQGALLSDVTVSKARPFMPVHGHDGNIQPTIRPLDSSSIEVAQLNLWMRGPWEVQLEVQSASAGDDQMVFHVCIAE